MAASSEMTALLKRSKRIVATSIKGECYRQNESQKLEELLNYLLDPTTKQIDDFETIDWCKWLIAGGSTFEDFAKTVRQYDNAVTCGLVWTANFVAYRCRTCGISPCMSLCAECFQAGNHEGHDFNMFRSQAGGACDCGDVNVMNPKGFCLRHGPDRKHQLSAPPSDLLAVAEAMMPRLFLRLIYHLRSNSKPEMRDTYLLAMQDAELFLGFLHSLSDMGAAMRRVMSFALTNPTDYQNLTKVEEKSDGSNKYYVESKGNYQAALTSLSYPKSFEEYEGMPGLNQTLIHRTFLEELVFWTVKFEFPQKIVTLLLSLLPDEKYKECFTRAFIQHYSRISRVLVNALDRQTVANRVVHISVQLFSNEQLARLMVKDYNLLYTLILSLKNMVESVLTESTLQDPSHNFHMVIDCSHEAMKDHCYWPIISDLINLLSHKDIAHKFLADSQLVTMWLELLSYFQGMNLNQRELSQHVEFEPDTYYAAFSAELEIAASPMWSLISHCRAKETIPYTRSMTQACITILQDWFDAVGCKETTKPNPLQLTFHLPLHRYLAIFMAQTVQHQGLDLNSIAPSERFLKTVLIHLLQIQATQYRLYMAASIKGGRRTRTTLGKNHQPMRSSWQAFSHNYICPNLRLKHMQTEMATTEIYASMWVRNGLQIKGQAMTYIQCHFCYSMIDADFYLMQVCACKLDPDYFVQTVLDRFHINDWLSYLPNQGSRKLAPEQEMAMVEGALQFFNMLLSVRTYLGIEDKELTRLEMASLLFISDRHHSQLMDLMPEKSGMTGHGKDLFEPTLKEISDFKAPVFEPGGGGLQQGTYVPKDDLWESDFDPLHVYQRAVYKKDFQSAMDRYTEFVRKKGKYLGKGQPWPPFKFPGKILETYKSLYQILHCRTMHAFLFTVLHRASKDASITEGIIYHAIHLLEIAVMTSPIIGSLSVNNKSFSGKVPDQNYKEWFPGSSFFQNICEVVQEVSVPYRSHHMDLEQEGTMTVNMDTSLEEMFQLAPSVLATSSGPITAAHSGIIPSITMISMATASSDAPNTHIPMHSTSSSQTVPKYESCGTSTEHFLSVKVGESLISVLLKLLAKMLGKTSTYVPLSVSNKTLSESNVGDGQHFIQRLLDRMCRKNPDCARKVEEICSGQAPKDAGKKVKTSHDKEERKKKARERQQKLMADFATKQKAFMEQAMETEADADAYSSTSASFESQEGYKGSVPEEMYDCVICGQSAPSTSEKTFGLVVLLQATSVLGHRPQTDLRRLLSLSDKQRNRYSTCANIQTKRLDSLLRHFEEGSCQMSVNIGWEGGVLVQTCGHYLHLDCHSSYMTSLRTAHNTQNLQVSKGEYSCPLCLQLANSVVPILPEENRFTLTKPVSHDHTQMVLDIAEMMVKRPITPRSASVTKAMGAMMEDLTNATYGQYKTFTRSQTSESVLLFVCSVARTNLEIELLQRGGDLSKQTSSSRKPCFLPLLHVLGMHSKILTTKPYTDIWSRLTGIPCTDESTSVLVYQKEVPLLLKDPSALLIQLVLTLPTIIDEGHYHFLLKMIYNMVFLQALVMMSCRFTEEEREAWRKMGALASLGTLEGMMTHVITRLGKSWLYDKDCDTEQGLPAICQSVWSPQSVECLIQDYFCPFLKICALIKHHLFQREFPAKGDLTEFQYLCSYLYLNVQGNTTVKPDKITSAASCLCWAVSEPHTLTRTWLTDLGNFIDKVPGETKNLLMTNPVWYPPHLIMLPGQYYKIFQAYRDKQCPVCSNVPKDPCVCLICGTFLCFREQCCQQQHQFECVLHSMECGAGTGIFLLINSSIVVVIRGPRATLWGSVYLDEHGEEDRDLKRGKPLYLSKDRYDLLERQWISHNFDHACKRWIWHQDHL